jgi:hypothetical protein
MTTSPGHGVDAQGNPVIDPTKNVEDLVRAEAKHTREIIELHAKHEKDLRKAEAKRINAIRTVDVNAVAAARSDAETRATALATQVANQADAVRTALAAALDPIQKDIADLRRSQYEGVGGKTQVAEGRAASSNAVLWVGLAVAVVVGFGGLFLTVAGIAVTFLFVGR